MNGNYNTLSVKIDSHSKISIQFVSCVHCKINMKMKAQFQFDIILNIIAIILAEYAGQLAHQSNLFFFSTEFRLQEKMLEFQFYFHLNIFRMYTIYPI